jgi:hypothetical protein
MKTFIAIITGFCLIFCTAAARANDAKDLERTSVNINAHATTPEGQTKVLNKISNETGVPVDTLKMQRSQTGLGYGELLIANSLATATGKTFDEIAALKASGQGWGKIAKTYNLKLGKIVSQARQTDDAITPPETKSKKKGKGDDNDFFNDNEKGAGSMRDSDHGHGQGLDNGNASHGSNSQSHGQGKGKGP